VLIKQRVACPICSTPFDIAKGLKQFDLERTITNPLIPKCGKDELGIHPKIPFSDALKRYDYNNSPIYQSRKITAILDLLEKWRKEAPDEKIIVFTQWRTFAATLGRFLESAKIPFVYYTVWVGEYCDNGSTCLLVVYGDRTPKNRTKSVNRFETDPDVNVMVSGLKCGGVGLNLAFASRVISVYVRFLPFLDAGAATFCKRRHIRH
jgi:SNF2 family DNA or RNA helicase